MDINIILNQFLTKKLRLEISNLKNKEWKYGVEVNLNWLNKNIKKNDIHILIKKNKELIAYNCLRKKKFLDNNKKTKKIYIFDSLIVKKKFRKFGLGKTLLLISNTLLQVNKCPGFLLCDHKNLNFYKKFYWILENKIIVENHKHSKNQMIFNIKKNIIKKVKY